MEKRLLPTLNAGKLKKSQNTHTKYNMSKEKNVVRKKREFKTHFYMRCRKYFASISSYEKIKNLHKFNTMKPKLVEESKKEKR